MDSRAPEPLRVLIANERQERLQTTTGLVAAMGHEVIARSLEVSQVAAATAETMPDVALVGLGESSQHALELISRIVQEAACPVIAILEVQDRAFIDRAARLGIFSYIVHAGDPQELQSAMDVALQRFAEYHALEGAFGRRAITERAKGILMERHGIDEHRAFEMLREQARRSNHKVVDVAGSVLESHRLLSSDARSPAAHDERPVRSDERSSEDA